MTITTSMADSFKVELLSGAHCFNATVTPTVTNTSGQTTFTSVSSMAGITVGSQITGTGISSTATYVAAITGTTTFTSSLATTASISAAAVTITGDVFKMALIKNTASTAYSNTNSTNYSVVTGATEEVTGTGYTATGYAMSNQSPIYGGSPVQGIVNFSPNPSWTSASFSTIGCMIYNTTDRFAGVTGRACGVFDFGGTQTVSNGTFTVVMPNFSSASAILRIA